MLNYNKKKLSFAIAGFTFLMPMPMRVETLENLTMLNRQFSFLMASRRHYPIIQLVTFLHTHCCSKRSGWFIITALE